MIPRVPGGASPIDAYPELTRDHLEQLGLAPEEAIALRAGLERASAIVDPRERWRAIASDVLRPSHPFAIHEAAFRETYLAWNPLHGPPPAWLPAPDARAHSNLGRLLDQQGFATDEAFRAWAIEHRAEFWGLMTQTLGIRFEHPYDAVVNLDDGPEHPRWFPGGRLNIARSCFQAPPEAIAIRQVSEEGTERTVTFAELASRVRRFAASLTVHGLKPGDAVGLLMPMTIEAIVATLGIVWAGGVVVGVSESFAPPEIALRLRLGHARLVIVQDIVQRRGARLPLLAKLASDRPFPAVVVVTHPEPPALRPDDQTWEAFLDRAGDPIEALAREPGDHITILFSSGTTGEPKAIPWSHTTPIKGASDAYLYHDLRSDDVVAWPTSPGWMMGPWLIFATLINRATIALFDGHPGSETFCRFVQDAGVTVLGLVPSLVSAWKAGDWPSRLDWSRIRRFSSTGECSNPTDMLYLMSRAGYRPIVEYCGGTEIGGGYITSGPLHPNAPACFNTITHGITLSIRDEEGRPASRGEGYLIGPSLGLSVELLNRDHHETYFAGCPSCDGSPLRRHGDQIEQLPGGYYRVLGRVDDTMNLGGIKVAAVEIERVWNRHPEVADSAAVTQHAREGGPDRLVAFVVPSSSSADVTRLKAELQARLSDQLNPLFRISEVVLVESLPRTASNKMMRRLLRARPEESR